jgi:hypothetical protein
MYYKFTDNQSNIEAFYTTEDISLPYDDFTVPVDKNHWVIKENDEIYSLTHDIFTTFYSPSDELAKDYVDEIEILILNDKLSEIKMHINKEGNLSFNPEKLSFIDKMSLLRKVVKQNFTFNIRN